LPTWAWGGGGYAYSSLVDLKNKSGLKQVTLAFVLSGGTCRANGAISEHLSDIRAFISAGGHVKASFGGALGTYIETGCADASALAKAIGDFVTATGITDLDFDIEQDAWQTDSANDMRAKALKMVQDSKNIKVAFTLEAVPATGLTDRGKSVVSRTVAAGVRVSHVNLMTMDYGDSFGGKPMAPVVIGSLNGVHYQLQTIIPGITSQQAWNMVGVIPMIGKNDDAEIFSLADARTVAQFAVDNKLGLVSFWSIDRDQPCGAGREACNSVSTSNFEFTKIFAVVAP
jgi:chitinase